MLKCRLVKGVFLMMNTLSSKPCFLVQRGTFKNHIQTVTKRSDLINFDYMGSAEFECGALPQSTIRMLTNIQFYDIISFPQYVNFAGEELKVYGPKMFISHIKEILDNLALDTIHLKEYCGLSEYLQSQTGDQLPNFWWDIENDFYIFFGEEKATMILELHRILFQNSDLKIKLNHWNKLSKYYLLMYPDLDEEARNFLMSKQKPLVKSLIKTKFKKKSP